MNAQQVKNNRAILEEYLESKGFDLTGKKFLCPNPDHNDHSPSANIYESRINGVYVKCYSCGFHEDVFGLKFILDKKSQSEVMKELGVSSTSQQSSQKQSVSFDTIGEAREWMEKDEALEFQGIYDYYGDPKTSKLVEIRYFNHRENKKEFKPFYRISERWIMGLPDKERPLYNHTKITPDVKILIVEGAKCADAFNSLKIDGWLAVSSINGAESYYRTDWTPVLNNSCTIWRDFDKAGLKYQQNLISHLRSKNENIDLWRIPVEIECQNYPIADGGDVADLVADEVSKEDIEEILANAKWISAVDALRERLPKIESGEYAAVSFDFLPVFTNLAQPMVPGSWTMLCGNKGSTKSFFVSEIGLEWARKDCEDFSILFLEENEAFYQMRALGQLAQNSNFTNLAWAKGHMNEIQEAFEQYGEMMEKFFKHVSYVNSKQVKYSFVRKWIEQQILKGKKKIIIDPITATEPEAFQHIADNKFVMGVKEMIEAEDAALLSSIHPRMNGGKNGNSNQAMARSLAFENLTQYIVWLINHLAKVSTVEIGDNVGLQVNHNKTLFIEKTRHGKSQGRAIAMEFGDENLRFTELGLMLTDEEIKKLDKVEFIGAQKF